ncbi:hypothetical protein SAMN05660686_02433 [Thalassobaculum litoreum DSM 18839]|uniref:Uncharacterized protein n=1 Tax=Thalassobaculum litoreum DSM 18839 TaxID=1123362 RepID=A0A8G2EYG7_9PROT|nr:hypothetical protein SAMN05660686_02433 [Thalassobaculum litoreum DSM 18839]
MTYGRRIAAHAKQVTGLRRQQVQRVRAACQARELSTRQAGRLVGLSQVRGLFADDWAPPQDVLDALEAALFGEDDTGLEPLHAATIPSQAAVRLWAPNLVEAVEVWQGAGGVWSQNVAEKLEKIGLLDQSTLVRDTPRGLYIEGRQDRLGYWRSATAGGGGVMLFDRPDPEYNAFVFKRVMGALAAGQPSIERCAGWCGLIGINLRYTAGLYPFAKAQGRPPEIVLSLVKPDPDLTPPPQPPSA